MARNAGGRRSIGLSSPPQPRSLVLWCEDWPVRAAGQGPSSLTAVVEGERVVAASALARSYGVRSGQRRREAQSLCPDLLVLPRDEHGEARAFEPVLAALRSFGAALALGPPGWVALRLRGPARYFGGEAAFAALLDGAVAAVLEAGSPSTASSGERGWRIGIADGLFAASLAAHEGLVIPPGKSPAFLAPLPVEALEESELTALLRHLGITDLAAFGALGEGEVLARFGRRGGELWRLARGLGEWPLAFGAEPPDFLAELCPEEAIGRLDEAAFALRTLAGELAERLARAGLACTLLEVTVELSGGERLTRRWNHEGPFSASLITERLRFSLERLLVGAPGEERAVEGGITLLRLEAAETTSDPGRELQLWGSPGHQEEQVARTLARLQGLAGPEAVLRPLLAGGRGPLERVRLLPFGTGGGGGAASAAHPWPGHLPPPSPALVASGALAAELLDAEGESLFVSARGLLSGRPCQLRLGRGPASTVRAWCGPWPVDERWWEPVGHRRRARLQVLLEEGAAYLLALEGGSWTIEGRYD